MPPGPEPPPGAPDALLSNLRVGSVDRRILSNHLDRVMDRLTDGIESSRRPAAVARRVQEVRRNGAPSEHIG